MKVAFVLNTTIPLNGATKAFLSLAQGLQARGVQICVVVPDSRGICPDLQQKDVPVLVLNYRPCTYTYLRTWRDALLFLPRMTARMVVNRQSTRKLAAWLKSEKVDLVHTNVGVIRIGFDAARLAGIPHVYHIREYADKIGLHYFPTKSSFLKQLHKPSSYSICITHAIQDYYGQTGRNTSCVAYDAACSYRSHMPDCQKEDYFLYVGRIEPVKGLDFLLEAYADYVSEVAQPLPLWVAGGCDRPAYMDRLQRIMVEKHLEKNVHMMGERHDVERLMLHARAIIIPSTFEGFGFCMPEAMSNGCLAIGRETSGTQEQMDNGVNHTGGEIALRFVTRRQLATHLIDVTTQPQSDFEPYRLRAFQTVNALYTPEASASKVFNFYQKIIR